MFFGVDPRPWGGEFTDPDEERLLRVESRPKRALHEPSGQIAANIGVLVICMVALGLVVASVVASDWLVITVLMYWHIVTIKSTLWSANVTYRLLAFPEGQTVATVQMVSGAVRSQMGGASLSEIRSRVCQVHNIATVGQVLCNRLAAAEEYIWIMLYIICCSVAVMLICVSHLVVVVLRSTYQRRKFMQGPLDGLYEDDASSSTTRRSRRWCSTRTVIFTSLSVNAMTHCVGLMVTTVMIWPMEYDSLHPFSEAMPSATGALGWRVYCASSIWSLLSPALAFCLLYSAKVEQFADKERLV